MLATKGNFFMKYKFFRMGVDKSIVIAYPNFQDKIHVDLCYECQKIIILIFHISYTVSRRALAFKT